MWTEEPGCRFFVVVDWAMVCVVYRVWYVWCWGGLAVFFLCGVALLVECGDGSGSRSGRQRILLFSRENRREIILRREIKTSCGEK